MEPEGDQQIGATAEFVGQKELQVEIDTLQAGVEYE